jgi:hypothetical protein
MLSIESLVKTFFNVRVEMGLIPHLYSNVKIIFKKVIRNR